MEASSAQAFFSAMTPFTNEVFISRLQRHLGSGLVEPPQLRLAGADHLGFQMVQHRIRIEGQL
jgi:hypothetical protein